MSLRSIPSRASQACVLGGFVGRKARKMDSTSIHVQLRKNPFQAGSAVAANVGWVAVLFLLHTVGNSLEAQQFVPSNTTNAGLATFQAFVNGELPVKEAVVYRKITRADGTLVNQEWWRFGYQENTWYVERLEPDKDDAPTLVPLWDREVFGASFTHVWTVSDKNIHVAARDFGAGGVPDTHGGFPRGLLFSALSLGLPRNSMVSNIEAALIKWDGLEFLSVWGRKTEPTGVLREIVRNGKLALGDDGFPVSAEFPDIPEVPGGFVRYEYNHDVRGIPGSFTARYNGEDMEYRYEFLSLTFGTNDLTQTDGYVPSLFADLALARSVMIWTNDKPYSVMQGKLQPAFGARVLGRHPKRSGLIILTSLAVASAVILALWYWRSEKKHKHHHQQQP